MVRWVLLLIVIRDYFCDRRSGASINLAYQDIIANVSSLCYLIKEHFVAIFSCMEIVFSIMDM